MMRVKPGHAIRVVVKATPFPPGHAADNDVTKLPICTNCRLRNIYCRCVVVVVVMKLNMIIELWILLPDHPLSTRAFGRAKIPLPHIAPMMKIAAVTTEIRGLL